MDSDGEQVPKIGTGGPGCSDIDFDAWLESSNAALLADLEFLQVAGIMEHTEDSLTLLRLDPDRQP